jgi:hypothetical protein
MKKISALILAVIVAVGSSAISAQDKTGQSTDSAAVVAEAVVTDDAADVVVDSVGSENQTEPKLTKDGDQWMLTMNGKDYDIYDLVVGRDIDPDARLMMDHSGSIVAMVALIFGLPSLAFIAALFIIFYYALKRNRQRNEVINNAIEHNYQLPDAFYSGQKGAQKNGYRNPKRFYSAWTFIAVGVAFVIFSIIKGESFFFLVGAIPLLIGIGRMIGYYGIPDNNQEPPRQPYGSQPPFQQPPYQQPQGQQPPYPQPPYPQAPYQTPVQPTPPPYNPDK